MATPYISDMQSDDTAGRLPDWREIVAILMERAWIGITVALIVFSVFFIQLKRAVPYYRSTAVLMVDSQVPRIMNYQSVVSLNVRNLEYFNTIINTLHSRKMMEAAVQLNGLMENPDFFPGVTGVVQKAASAKGLVSIQPVEKSRLINVTVEYSNPQVASDLANAMAQAYIQQDLDNRMNRSMQTVDWLRVRSGEYRQKLEQGLRDLQEYRENTDSISLEEDQNVVVAKLNSLNATLTEAQLRRLDAESRLKAVQVQVDAGLPRTELAVHLEDENLRAALSVWHAQQQRIVELQQRYKADYPDLKEALKLEVVLRKKFEASCDQAVKSLKTHCTVLSERENALKAALKAQEKLAFSLDRKLVKYNEMKRNVEADQEIYQSMISRMKEASISETLPSEVIRLAQEARPASRPFSPNPQQALLRGVLFGLVLGVGVIFILYYSDHRFRRNEEVERALGVPVLTSLPFIAGKTVHDRGMICHLDQTSEVAEAFRTLRAITQISPGIKDASIFLVTSTQPGEGKSLVSTNLATSFAQDNQKTLLIGADLRRPAFKHIFDVKEMPAGLSEILKGKVKWQETLCSDLIPNLDVIASGAIPSHPAELLGNPQMALLMKDVREVYDRVVIDSSPMMGVSDSLLLTKHVDGVLFVVRQGVTHSLGATHAMKRMLEGGVPCLGALMNGVNLRSIANYYYYRRYGGYGYQQYKAQSQPQEDAE